MEVLEKYLDYIETETKSEINYIYDKLYTFLKIDLTIFPIILAIFYAFLPSSNYISIIFSLICFSIAVFYKLYLIAFKFKKYLTTPTLFDVPDEEPFLTDEQKKIELRNHRMQKVRWLWEYYIYDSKFIIKVNQTIWFSASTLMCILTYLLQIQLVQMKINSIEIFWIILIINAVILGLAVFYKFLRKLTLRKP